MLECEERLDVTLGDYMEALYDEFLDELADEDLAEVATLAVVQQRLVEQRIVPLEDAASQPA